MGADLVWLYIYAHESAQTLAFIQIWKMCIMLTFVKSPKFIYIDSLL